MKKHSKWLLKYIADLSPLGLSTTSKLPTDAPCEVCLSTLRGLQKSGYVIEERRIFFITESGLDLLNECKEKTHPRRQA